MSMLKALAVGGNLPGGIVTISTSARWRMSFTLVATTSRLDRQAHACAATWPAKTSPKLPVGTLKATRRVGRAKL